MRNSPSQYMHSSGATRRRTSQEHRLPPLGRVSLDAPLHGRGVAPRPGTAIQNFAMGKVQALLQPMLEDMFTAQPENPWTVSAQSPAISLWWLALGLAGLTMHAAQYMSEYLGGAHADGARKMEQLMSDLAAAKERIAELEHQVEKQVRAACLAGPPVAGC
jgi:hypothetical protein